MRDLALKKIGQKSIHKNTLDEYDREIHKERFRYVTEKISESIQPGKASYIFGMGKHSKSSYTNLKGTAGIEVVWTRSIIPVYLSPLRIFIASYAGVVKVLNHDKIPLVFEILSKMSMVGLYIFDIRLEEKFTQVIKERRYSNYADDIVKEDSQYFIYKVDADSIESSTGIFEIVSYGIDCPKELITALGR